MSWWKRPAADAPRRWSWSPRVGWLFREAEAIVRQQSAYRLAACLGNGCILFAFRDESDAVLRLAEELLPLAEQNGFNLWAKMAHFFRGWAMADIDGSADGTSLMQETVRDLEDQEVDKSCYLGLLSKALLRTGQLDQASEAITKGLDQSDKIGEHYYTAELLRLRGEVEASRGMDLKAAEASFHEAISFAHGQAARSWERNATESLTRFLLAQQEAGTSTQCS